MDRSADKPGDDDQHERPSITKNEGNDRTSSLFHGIISGPRRRGHDEVADRADRIASGLQKLGVKQGDSVCILMRNDIAFIEAAYAAMRLGAYGVPVNWHFKPEEINYVLKDSGTPVLIAPCRHAASVARGDPAGRHRAQRADAAGNSRQLQDRSAIISPRPISRSISNPGCKQHPRYDGPAVPQPQNMIYTSGTTGHPKGVRRYRADAGADRQRRSACAAMIYGLKPGARALLPGPLYHSAPNSFGLRAGRLGGALVLMPRFDPEEFLRLIETEKIDTIFMVPTMFIRLMKLPEEVRKKYDMSSLRHIIHAAAPCPADVKRAMIEWWGPVIYEFYGSTESGAVTFATSEDALKKPGTVGKIAPGRGAALHRRRRQGVCRRARSAKSIRASPAIRISPITTSRKSAPRSIATASSPRATSATSTRTAMSSSATASATW